MFGKLLGRTRISSFIQIRQALHALIHAHRSVVLPTQGVLPILRDGEPRTKNQIFASSTYHTDSTNPAGVTPILTSSILHLIMHRVSLCLCERGRAFVYVTLPCQSVKRERERKKQQDATSHVYY